MSIYKSICMRSMNHSHRHKWCSSFERLWGKPFGHASDISWLSIAMNTRWLATTFCVFGNSGVVRPAFDIFTAPCGSPRSFWSNGTVAAGYREAVYNVGGGQWHWEMNFSDPFFGSTEKMVSRILEIEILPKKGRDVKDYVLEDGKSIEMHSEATVSWLLVAHPIWVAFTQLSN